jgi:hypothetical protein
MSPKPDHHEIADDPSKAMRNMETLARRVLAVPKKDLPAKSKRIATRKRR